MITIEVTEEDIKSGLKADCYACPVSRAMSRATGGRRWSVGWHKLQSACKPWMYANTPEVVRRFIMDFDEVKEVQPFQFEVDLEKC